MRPFYIGTLLRVLRFDALSWSNFTPSRLRTFAKIERITVLLVTGALHTTPTSSRKLKVKYVFPFYLHFKECILNGLFCLRDFRILNVAQGWLLLYKETSVRDPHSPPNPQASRFYHAMTCRCLDILKPGPVQSGCWDFETSSNFTDIKPSHQEMKIPQEANPQQVNLNVSSVYF